MTKQAPQHIQSLIDRGALFVVNHSGGKDSQAMLIKVRAMVPAEQILVIHADLPGVEWKGTEEHARRYATGLEFRTVRATKTFLEMVRSRGMWPSSQYRQCTSDLKRGPIEKAIRSFIKEKGLSGLVVNCTGIRAQESTNRAKQQPFRFDERNSKAGREWYNWMPIFLLSETQVRGMIAEAGEELHWAYSKGMSRLSCCFCIMASKEDIQISARENPELFQEILALEKEIGHTVFQGQSLDQYMLYADQRAAKTCA